MTGDAKRDLCRDALEIWQAGVDAVCSERLIAGAVQRNGDRLTICNREFHLPDLERIAVVGAGKAGAGMAAAIEAVLGDDLVDRKVVGWVNVPADCVRPLRKITLHAARPAGVNEPTEAGVFGTEQILKIVSSLTERDLCIVLISGGGSALLPAPVAGITLADKQVVTRFLMHAGATIGELNTVRKQLSRVKGGNLARACRAGSIVTLIISDVIGDPLDVIASGPTVADTSTPAAALAVLEKFSARPPMVPAPVFAVLKQAATNNFRPADIPSGVENCIIGNNSVALNAAALCAAQLGYQIESLGSSNQGDADAEGRALAERCIGLRGSRSSPPAPTCLLSGGEPIVKLATSDQPRLGGRNQQLALSALNRLWDDGMENIAILSGGTDGEDGPTDAAGACASACVINQARERRIDPHPYLAINDAYHFFEQAGGLIKTGPTHTNVMDLRVALVAP